MNRYPILNVRHGLWSTALVLGLLPLRCGEPVTEAVGGAEASVGVGKLAPPAQMPPADDTANAAPADPATPDRPPQCPDNWRRKGSCSRVGEHCFFLMGTYATGICTCSASSGAAKWACRDLPE
jgi:hypothetical protein